MIYDIYIYMIATQYMQGSSSLRRLSAMLLRGVRHVQLASGTGLPSYEWILTTLEPS